MSFQRYRNKMTPDGDSLTKADDGDWMLYADHEAELAALRAERDAAEAEAARLKNELDEARAIIEGLPAALDGTPLHNTAIVLREYIAEKRAALEAGR